MTTSINYEDKPSNYTLDLISDIHTGSKLCHYDALKGWRDDVLRRSNHYVGILGDVIEGTTTKHIHYDHTAMGGPDWYTQDGEHDLHTLTGQMDAFREFIRPLRFRTLGVVKGNHDWRYDHVGPIMRDMCKQLNVPYLGPRSHVRIGGVQHFWMHKGKMLPKGAKDPRQRQANRHAALQRNLEGFLGSAHFMAHGHTHELEVASPIEDPVHFLAQDDGTHRWRTVPWQQQGVNVDGFPYIRPEARWYAVTGTWRRSGVIQDINESRGYDTWDDYSDREPYTPTACGFVRVKVMNDIIKEAYPVYV